MSVVINGTLTVPAVFARKLRPGTRQLYGCITVRLRCNNHLGLSLVAAIEVDGSSTEHYAAQRKARAMPQGTEVTVYGSHLDLTATRDGAIHLLIQGVTDITPRVRVYTDPDHHEITETLQQEPQP